MGLIFSVFDPKFGLKPWMLRDANVAGRQHMTYGLTDQLNSQPSCFVS